MNRVEIADPIMENNCNAARYAIMHIRTDTMQIQVPTTIQTMPAPSMAMNTIIRLPTQDGLLHVDLSEHAILMDPQGIIERIRAIPVPEREEMPHVEFREGDYIAVNKLTRWMKDVCAGVDFAVMETFLFGDYVGVQVTSSVQV
jgi:hypothetical protein